MRGDHHCGAPAIPPTTGGPKGAPAADQSERLERQLRELRSRLRVEFDMLDPLTVDDEVDGAWHRSAGARVQQYRVVLAERDARRSLSRLSAASTPGVDRSTAEEATERSA